MKSLDNVLNKIFWKAIIDIRFTIDDTRCAICTSRITHRTSKIVNNRRHAWLIVPILSLFFVSFPLQAVKAQSSTETIQRTARFQVAGNSENSLNIYNIQGHVTVEGYDGDEVRIEAIKKIDADSQRDLERSEEEIEFVVEEEGDRILVYIDAPFIHVKKRGDRISYNIRDWDDDYDFVFDITIQAPRNINLRASTINNGKVVVENIRGGELDISNVNGKIELVNVSGTTDAHTVNGDITASYTENPTSNSNYQTINGTIEVLYPEDLSADILFKSMHGDLYTDFQNLKRLPARVDQEKDSRRGETTYRIGKQAPLRIGNGGPEFSFEVLNGDVYVKRIKS